MSNTATPSELAGMLDLLADDLEGIRVRVPGNAIQFGDDARRSLIADVRGYLSHRLREPGMPLVVAVAGPSGAGVSTVVNALAGQEVSEAGILRPTTKDVAVWTPQGNEGRWWKELLDRLGVDEASVVVAEGAHVDDVPWLLVDVPAALGPGQALDLAALADLCVFVNTPTRYADAEAAALAIGLFERGVPTWFVLNKLPEDVALRFEIAEAYAGLLHSWRLIETSSPEMIEQASDTSDGAIPADELGGLRASLASLTDDAHWQVLLGDAVAARLAAVSVRAEEVAEAVEDDRDSVLNLSARAEAEYTIVSDELRDELAGGGFAALTVHSSWPEAAVDLSGIVTRRAGLAAQRACAAWESAPAGRVLLADGGGALRRHGEQAAYEAQGLFEAWFEELGVLIREASPRRTSNRTRTKLAEQLWPLVLDPEAKPPRRLARRVGPRRNELIREARGRLGVAMTDALDRDRARFDGYLGGEPDVARLGRVMTTASVLSVIEPTGLERTIVDNGGDGGEVARPPIDEVEAPLEQSATQEWIGNQSGPVDEDSGPADLAHEDPSNEDQADDHSPERDEVSGPDVTSGPVPDAPSTSDAATEPVIDLTQGSPRLDNGISTSTALPEVPAFELPDVPGPPADAAGELVGSEGADESSMIGPDDGGNHVDA